MQRTGSITEPLAQPGTSDDVDRTVAVIVAIVSWKIGPVQALSVNGFRRNGNSLNKEDNSRMPPQS